MRAKYGLKASSFETEEGATSDSIMCGWLLKRGKVNKAFKQRWFRLVGSNIEYYADLEGDLAGKIDISNRASIQLVSKGKVPELHIGVGNGDRTYILRADPDARSASLEQWQIALIHAQENTRFD